MRKKSFKTEEEFLNYTVKYYSENPKERRNVVDRYGEPLCAYYPVNDTSLGCAIGQHLDKAQAKFLDINHNYGAMVTAPPVIDIMPKWMKKFDLNFLSSVQLLHDDSSYWTDTGLSPLGEHRVQEIRNRYCGKTNKCQKEE